jgi:aldose 1-epimerase
VKIPGTTNSELSGWKEQGIMHELLTQAFSSEVRKDPELGVVLFLRYKDRDDYRKNIEIAIAPEFGSNMFRFRIGERDIFYCDRKLLRDHDWTGNFPLWPLPNRVRDKRYTFEGRTISLESIRRKRGNRPLIHGLVDDQVWEYEEPGVEKDCATVTTHISITGNSPLYRYFPFESELTLQYTLYRDGVKVQYTVSNNEHRGTGKNMPFGFALHPYFATLSGRAKTFVTLPADYVMEADEELLPSGKLLEVTGTEYDLRRPTPVDGLQLDTVFTGLHPGEKATVDFRTLGMRIYFNASDDFTHLILYTLEDGFICLENQTGSTDMINLHARAVEEQNLELEKAAHLLTLPPGQTHTGYIAYQIENYM